MIMGAVGLLSKAFLNCLRPNYVMTVQILHRCCVQLAGSKTNLNQAEFHQQGYQTCSCTMRHTLL